MSSLPPIVFVRQQTRKDQRTNKTAVIEAVIRGILARHFRRDLSLKLIRAFQRAGVEPLSADCQVAPSDLRTRGCRNSARTMNGVPTATGNSQNAIGGNLFQSGRFLPLST